MIWGDLRCVALLSGQARLRWVALGSGPPGPPQVRIRSASGPHQVYLLYFISPAQKEHSANPEH